ncbi:capsid cement protein [Bradyrhizobium sp. DASA03005]|uniref:capsid cement protein n=1 Tax=Bradyrhizobium sp. SPXBL-02 TaxID=3395912 RepID=UPI003F71C42F
MANNGLTKSYTAEGAISANAIVKVGANDYGILQGAAATDKLIGITTEVAAVLGEQADVVLEGIADLKLGGAVARGDLLTSDAAGLGVTAAPAAGSNNRIIAMALISGVAGDLIPVKVLPGSLQG